MFVFNIPRRIINIGLALVHPRWRLIVSTAILGIINVIVGQLGALMKRSDIAGLPPREYLQNPHPDYWVLAFAFCCVGMMPLFSTILPIPQLTGRRPRLDKQVDQALTSLGLKGRVHSTTIMLYQGMIDDRQITIFVDARRPKRGVYMTPQPKSVVLNPSIQIRMNAAHRGDMSLLPEACQPTRLPPQVIKMPVDQSVLSGMTMLTLDVDWSNRLLAIPEVTAAIRRLAPEGDPDRLHVVAIGALIVSLQTQFTSSQGTVDPLAQSVAVENVQQILADLKVLAEAAESLPEPTKPGPDDNLTRISSIDPAAGNQLPILIIWLVLSVGWCIANAVPLFRH